MIQIFLILILIFTPIARGAVRIWAFGPTQILTLLVFSISILRLFGAKSNEIRIKRTPVDIPIALFFLLGLISIFNSSYIYGSIAELVRLTGLGMIFYMVVNFIDKEEDIKRVLNVILAISSSIALFGIFQYLGVVDKSWWDSSRFLSATYVNHNHFAGYMELVIPLSIGMILAEREIGKRSMYIYAFLVLSIAFLLSMSRGGWLSLSLAMVFMLFMIFRKVNTRFILLIAFIFFVTLGIFIFTSMDMGFLLRRISSYRELDFAGRASIWKGTIEVIKHNWLFGTGLGSFIYNFPRYRPLGLNAFINYAHSDYLQVASEVGIAGLFLMVFIIFNIIKKGIKTHGVAKSSFKRWISLSLATGILSMAIHGIGDFNFYIPANAILFTVFSGFIFNISSRREKGCENRCLSPILNRCLSPFFLVVAVMCLIFVSVSFTSEVYSTLSEKELSLNNTGGGERFALLAARINPFNYTYRYKLGGIYARKGDNSLSEKSYKEALRLNPLDSWSWLGLGDAYYGLYGYSPLDKRFIDFARESYEKAVELDPSNSYYLKKFARFLFNTGDTALSGKMYKKASKTMSESRTLSQIPVRFTDSNAYEDTADLAFSAQDIEKALAFYRMAEEFEGASIGPKLGLVRCYGKMSLVKEALGKYRDIKGSNGASSVLFASLGGYYFKKGYYGTAERFSYKAIAANPQNPEGYQLRHKISKRLNGGSYIEGEVSRILDFNTLRYSRDFREGYFELGFSLDRKLHNEGTIILDLVLPAGIYEFDIRAKGEKAKGIWPHMIVKFNDSLAMETYVNTAILNDYKGLVVVDYHANRFEIGYDNDYYDSKTNEDRNLYIEGISLRSLY